MRTIAWFFYSLNVLWPHSQDTNEVHQQQAAFECMLKIAKTNKFNGMNYTWNSIIIHVRKRSELEKTTTSPTWQAETMKCLSVLFSLLLNCVFGYASLFGLIGSRAIFAQIFCFNTSHPAGHVFQLNNHFHNIKRKIIKKSCSKMQIWRLNFQ